MTARATASELAIRNGAQLSFCFAGSEGAGVGVAILGAAAVPFVIAGARAAT